MFALWRSRLVQSGVADHEAVQRLIFALRAILPLAHLADRCKDMLGKSLLSIHYTFWVSQSFHIMHIVLMIDPQWHCILAQE